MRFKLVHIIYALLFFGCSGVVETPNELIRYLNDTDNGIYQTIESKGVKIVAFIKPSDLLAIQELKAYTTLNKEQKDSIFNYYRNHLYVMIELSANDKPILQQVESKREYSELINTLSFNMSDYVYIISNSDTVRALDYQLGQFYGLEIANSLIFSFPSAEILNNSFFNLVIEDFGIGTNPCKIKFKTKNIKRIPHLNTNKFNGSY